MSNKDDIGFDDEGRPFVIGQDPRAARIVDHPDAVPVLVVVRLGDELGVRAYGPPSLELADLLDHCARTYRQAVLAAAPPTEDS